MNTPTLSFSHLSIQGGMAQPPHDGDSVSDSEASYDDERVLSEEDIDERRREMQDFLCSFQPNALPSEWAEEENLSDRVTSAAAQTDPSSWTASTDLNFTLLQWACYEPSGQMLAQYRRIKSPRERALSFIEALRRRFGSAFTRYDNPDAENALRAAELVEELETLTNEAHSDRVWRVRARDPGWLSPAERREYMQRLLNVLVLALRRAVEATSEPRHGSPPVTRSQRFSGDHSNILFYVLFVEEQTSDFMLGLLESILEQGPAPMNLLPRQDDIRVIWQQLVRFRARETYRNRFQEIFEISA